MINAPLSLDSYRESVTRAKMTYVAALLRWVSAWLAEVQDMTLDAALDGLAHAKQVRRYAYAVEKVFEEAAIAEMHHAGQVMHVGEGYTAVMRPGGDRKGWKHDQVMTSLIDQTCQRMSERFPYLPPEALRAVVTESMWQVHKTGRIEWRSTDLRRNGVDPDEHSTRTPEAPTIDLRGEASYINVHRRPRGVPHMNGQEATLR